jgi:hypothetical protein
LVVQLADKAQVILPLRLLLVLCVWIRVLIFLFFLLFNVENWS